MYNPGCTNWNHATRSSPCTTVVTVAPPPGPVTAWKSTLWGMPESSLLVTWTSSVSPTRARMNGPGTWSLNVQDWYFTSDEIGMRSMPESSVTRTIAGRLTTT